MATIRKIAPPKARPIPMAPAAIAEDAFAEVLELHEESPWLVGTPAPEQREEMIRVAAYYLSEQRGFEPGHESEDWLAAERAIDEIIARRTERA